MVFLKAKQISIKSSKWLCRDLILKDLGFASAGQPHGGACSQKKYINFGEFITFTWSLQYPFLPVNFSERSKEIWQETAPSICPWGFHLAVAALKSSCPLAFLGYTIVPLWMQDKCVSASPVHALWHPRKGGLHLFRWHVSVPLSCVCLALSSKSLAVVKLFTSCGDAAFLSLCCIELSWRLSGTYWPLLGRGCMITQSRRDRFWQKVETGFINK